MFDRRVRRQLALDAVGLFLLITASLSSAAVARAQDDIAAPPTETPATAPPALTLEVTADMQTFSAVGEVIAYTYALTNTGTVALDAVTVTDTKVEEQVGCQSLFLEPGQSVSCTGSYPVTQADLDAGSLTNVAQGFGRVSESTTIVFSNEASLTITGLAPELPEPASLTLELGAAGVTTFSAVDEYIVYTYYLTNTGGVALDYVYVTDSKAEDLACPPGPLEPGESYLCTGDYFTSQADLDAGSVTSVAQGYGVYGESEEVASGEASLTITYLAPEPAALTLEMRADVTTFSAVGDYIVYTYDLTNTGGAALDVLSVTGTMVGDVECESHLEPDWSWSCIALYDITQADIDAGSVTNVARGYGTYGLGEEVESNEVSLTITADSTP